MKKQKKAINLSENNIVILSLFIWFFPISLCNGNCLAFGRCKESNPIRLLQGPQLFIDDYLIADSNGLKRTTHQPVKHPNPIFHVPPGQVLYDCDSSRYRMWYTEHHPVSNLAYALAESKDGIEWYKPELGLVEAGGSKKNNYIDAPAGCFQGQFWDEGPDFADAARRYKMAFFSQRRGMCVAFSPDGLRYTEFKGNPVIQTNENDIPYYEPGYKNVISDVITGCWDPLKKEYLVICKVEEGGYPGKPHHHAEGYRRVVGMTASKDFIVWEKPKIIIRPDPKNGLEEFYAFTPMVRGNLYIGFLHVLRDDLPATQGGPVEGIGWTELVTSRDGRNWTRYQEKFLDRDLSEGRFDHAMAWCGDSIIVGDKEYIYYAALLSGHKTDRVHGRKSGLAVLRKNGFVSRDAGRTGGLLRTRLVVFNTKAITINADVKGQLKVRLLNKNGKPLPGFDLDDCKTICGDSVSHFVSFKGNLQQINNQPVYIEFLLTDAQLYGFSIL